MLVAGKDFEKVGACYARPIMSYEL
jgi:hypothetical protein